MPLPRPSRGPKSVKMDPQTLLEAALKVFARLGLEGASLRAIAREAGCDPSLIYYHFENKEAMFSALLQQRLPPMVQDLRRLAHLRDPRSTAEKLWAAQQILHSHLCGSAGFRSLVRGQLVRGAEAIQDQVARSIRPAQLALLTLIRRGLRRGELRPGLDPFLLILFLVRMEAELMDLEPETALALAERTWFQVFWRGIAVDPLAPLPFQPFAEHP